MCVESEINPGRQQGKVEGTLTTKANITVVGHVVCPGKKDTVTSCDSTPFIP